MGYGPPAIEKTRRAIGLISEGDSAAMACKATGISYRTFCDVILGESELALDYDRAKRNRADLDADKIVEVAEDPNVDAQRARNIIDARKWRASKQHASVYGDRVDLNINGTISISETLALARKRLVPRTAQQDVLDVEVVEQPVLSEGEAKVGDIFS